MRPLPTPRGHLQTSDRVRLVEASTYLARYPDNETPMSHIEWSHRYQNMLPKHYKVPHLLPRHPLSLYTASPWVFSPQLYISSSTTRNMLPTHRPLLSTLRIYAYFTRADLPAAARARRVE
eukprot:426556-Rhodomonas_salina.1